MRGKESLDETIFVKAIAGTFRRLFTLLANDKILSFT